MVFDKVITVCLNPSLDLTIWVDKLDLNEPVSAASEKVYAGGKAINVARVLTSLDIKNSTVAIVGSENSLKLSTLLDIERVNYKFISINGSIRENLSIVLPNEQLFKINRQGLSIDTVTIDKLVEAIDDELVGVTAPLLVFAGSLPCNMTSLEYKHLILKFTAKGIKVCLDTDILTKQDIQEIRPFIIKPNHIELSHIAESEFDSIEQVTAFAQTLTPYVGHVLVSVGGEGLIYTSLKQTHKYIPPNVAVKSTVGAGDTTVSGFIAAMCRDKPIADCVRYAGACGTASVMLEGTEVINRSDVEAILRLL